MDGYFRDTSTTNAHHGWNHDSQFVLRLPDDWNGGLVALFHRFDRTAFAWDLQFEHALSAALRMGCDGIYSDWVDRMVAAYRAEAAERSADQA